jgi:hypothetical protein
MNDKQFYNAKDIGKITGLCEPTCYEIISILQKKYQEEYPDGIIIKKLIPIEYFNRKVLGKEVRINEKN